MTGRSWFRRALAGLSVVLGSGLAMGARPALHPDLKSSAPANKARLTKIPTELRLTFTEAPEMALTRVTLRAPGGQPVSLGKLGVMGADRATVVASITSSLTTGTYTVEWEITGEDGHPVDGAFTFTVTAEAFAKEPPNTVAVTDSVTHHDSASMPLSRDRFDSESIGYVVVRFTLYSALLVVVGAVAFRVVVLTLVARRPWTDPALVPEAALRAANIGWAAAWVLLAAFVARLCAQSLAVNGIDGFADMDKLRTLIGATKWGKAWIVHLASVAIALYGLRRARARENTPSRQRAGWMLAGLAALTLAFTPAFTSHAAASPRYGALAIAFDGLHVMGAAGWLGSLLVVVVAGVPAAMALGDQRKGPAVAELIDAFSPTAFAFAGLVAVSGLFAAWIHIGGISALWEAKYGKLLLAKVLVVSVVAGTGAYNWLRIKPSLGTVEATARIRRSATVEVVVGIIVLLITAVLVATPTPMDSAAL